MEVVESVLELIGDTPLLRLAALEPEGGAEIWAKLEGYTPGGSVKDRIALGMIRAAEADGSLRPGGAIVEATAGNTGVGLALVGARLGYPVVLVVPAGYSVEKQHLMRALGAELFVTSAEGGMAEAQEKARSLTAERSGSLYVDQFENPANPDTHAGTTGPEIWEQAGGRVDGFVAGCGSGGTYTGAARYLKTRNPEMIGVAVEPPGSALSGDGTAPHEVEGIGMHVVHPVVDREVIDEIATPSDPQSFRMVRRLARECGVLSGSSGGANLVAAIELAERLGPGRRVVTVIPDSCERYMSKNILELFPEDE